MEHERTNEKSRRAALSAIALGVHIVRLIRRKRTHPGTAGGLESLGSLCSHFDHRGGLWADVEREEGCVTSHTISI